MWAKAEDQRDQKVFLEFEVWAGDDFGCDQRAVLGFGFWVRRKCLAGIGELF